MKTLVVGASGATGRLLVQQLLKKGQKVKVIVRSIENLPTWKTDKNVTIIQASVLDIDVNTMAEYLKDCHAVASCLGHNLTFKGIYGQPRKLVRDAVALLCAAIQQNQPKKPVKFILMNTVGNQNRDLNEPIPFSQKVVIGLVRGLLPAHADNEQAADYLRVSIGQNHKNIEWAAVRPDTLIDEEAVTNYYIYPSPTRSLFKPAQTSRINVGDFMAELMTNDTLWQKWKGQMPVIYNEGF